MTVGPLFGGPSPSGPAFSERFSPSSNKYYAGDRGDTGGGYPYSGSSSSVPQWKSKKADKKQAAMSALTLIAFLFFLNILKECIKDEMHPPSAMIMMVPNPTPTLDALVKEDLQPMGKYEDVDPMGKYEEVDLKTKDDFVKVRKLLSVDSVEEDEGDELDSTRTFEEVEFKLRDDVVKEQKSLSGNVEEAHEQGTKTPLESVLRTRKLLSAEESAEEDRSGKFIQNFEGGKRDWTNELTQISDGEIADQRQKLDNLKQLWKRRNVKKKPALDEDIDSIKVKKFVNSPIMSDLKGIPKLSQYWARQKTTTQMPETKSVEFEEHMKKVADFKEFETLNSEKTPDLLEDESTHLNDVAQSLQLRAAPVGEVEAVSDPFLQDDALNTPRYRRSDEILTTLPTEQLFYPESAQVVTANPTLAPQSSSTTRTYHVYTNPAQIYSNIWKTTAPPVSTTSTTQQSTPGKMDIDDIYFTTTKPPTLRYQPMLYPSNHRPNYKPLSRFRYSPNRRVAYEPPVVRQEYYPMSVVGQYGGDEDTSSLGGVFQLIWTLVSSFAKPISRIIPQMSSKVGREAQCFDLLACEAHRLGRLMGPTAKAVATTFSTVLLWVTPPIDKPALDAAVAAGNENSCVEQIAACDERSGGKSAMTMVAQLMELRGENTRRPHT